MNQEIKYTGYAAQPSDYESPDGQLAASLNLVPDNGSILPVLPPKKILTLSASGERILLVHSVPGRSNYIILRQGGDGVFSLFWLTISDQIVNTSTAQLIGVYSGFRDIAVIGNTLVVATDHGIRYALWKDRDSSYVPLGERPPFVSIEFGMYRKSIVNLNASDVFTIPESLRPGEEEIGWDGVPANPEMLADLATLTQMGYGLLLPQIAERVVSQGLFYMPFFVRYAFRLYDGSYIWHSAPVLMLPNILPPFIKCERSGSDGSKIKMTLDVPYFGLAYRILADGLQDLGDWSDIIAGIDMFISAPVYTYDQSKNLTWRPVTSTRNIMLMVSPDGTVSGGTRAEPAKVFAGHYADSIDGDYIDHYIYPRTHPDHTDSNPDLYSCLKILPHPDFHRNIESVHTFYKVAEFDVKDIAAMTQMKDLPMKDKDLSSLVTRPVLPDDYQSHARVIPSSLFAFNSRLSLAGLSVAPASPFPIRTIMQFGNPGIASPVRPRITVWTRVNGVRCYALRSPSASVLTDAWHSPADNFPRFIFYPDASAYRMEIHISDTQKYIINLVPHDFLNGAYWYRGRNAMSVTSAPAVNAEAEPTDYPTSVPVPAKIYTSEVNNPFLFPATGINTVGTGSIMALSSAVRALSQGQFGQFPVYAFSSDGVWALEVASSGGFISRHPVTRDVCVNPDSITQIDSAVLFASDRGIMMIQGATSVCISDSINAESVVSLPDLPSGDKVVALTPFSGSDIDILPFREFLTTCRMIYDYPHQRIIVFRPDTRYAYVYSLRSQAWGMMESEFAHCVDSYPKALAVTSVPQANGSKVNYLVDLSQNAEGSVSAVLLSRPLRLGLPDVLKTVDNVIQRGAFARGHVQSVLYGSRDLIHWHLVWSSQDHFLRGFSGSPYKYFRVALLCRLDEGESISGCSVRFTPRLTNQPR